MPEAPINLLIVQTDQQSLWTLSCYGSRLIETPNIDRLAEEGVLFENHFTCSALCTPSRGSFITGRYPNSHGAWTNNNPLDRNEITLAHQLSENGYETAYIGKWHLNGPEGLVGPQEWIPPDRAMGFKDCRYTFEKEHCKWVITPGQAARPTFSYTEHGPESQYMTDWLTDRAIDYVRDKKDSPFFLMISIPDPHTPYTVRQPYASMYDPKDMSVPKTFYDKKFSWWIEDWHDEWSSAFGADMDDPKREDTLRRNKAAYCGMVKCIDDNVGRLIDCLAAQHLLDNTLVVFTTDHGDYMGEHTIYGKNCVYETAYHIPLLIRCPQLFPSGGKVEELFSIVDFAPTVLGLLGIRNSGHEEGRDGSALLRNQQIPWDNECFYERHDGMIFGCFTPEFEIAICSNGKHAMFDRRNDPLQTNDLYADESYKKEFLDLANRTIAHYTSLGIPDRAKWLTDPEILT